MTVRSCRMIEAEMYGMIPSAKIVSRLRLPPEKRSRNPRIPPPCCRKNDSSAMKLIPGTGMCPPMRYTAIIRKVKTTRFLRSGMLKMFFRDSNMPSSLLRGRRDHLGAAARAGDLLQGRLAEPVRLHDEGLRQLSVAEDLDAGEELPDQPFLQQALGRDLARQFFERPDVHHRVLGAEQVGESPLRH